jgi:predicted NBD/HSP70 family sugar kinase
MLSAVPDARHVIGVKLTGDTAYGVACDLLGGVLGSGKARLPEPVDGTVPVGAAVAAVIRLVRRLSRGLPGLDGVGLSVGGVVSDRRIVHEGVFLGWTDVDLAGPVVRATGARVIVSNDVTALARAELWFGAGKSHNTFGLVTVGAGLGFGVVREGHVVEQLLDNGHLLGHAPVNTRGPTCDLGHRGCVAAYLYPDAISRRMSERLGRTVTYRELVAREDTRRPWFDDAARALGHLVATFAGALQTDRIVLAGEDVEPLVASPVMTETINRRLRDGHGLAHRCRLDISSEPLTFTDWARGAALTSIQHVLGAI